MKILSVDVNFNHPEVTYITFNSNDSFLGYDLIIWNPSSVFNHYDNNSPTEYNGCLYLTKVGKNGLKSDIARRSGEIKKLLENGKTIVIILPIPYTCYYQDNTGRNTTYRAIKMSDVLPFKDMELVLAEGENIIFNGPEILKPCWDNVKGCLHHYSYLKNATGEPFLFIKDTKEAVGTFFTCENGKVILFPGPKYFNPYSEKESSEVIRLNYIDGVKIINDILNNDVEEYKIDDWANKYLLPGEKDKIQLLCEKQQEIEKLESDADKILQDINDINKYKILLCGNGKSLEEQVARVLVNIGFVIIDLPQGRDDIIASYNDIPVVIEVKGTTKSAAEKHAAQLEKWVSNYYEVNNRPAKGILIANTFRDLPLENRNDESFPKQMLPYSISRGHCLITTVQLLGLYLHIMSHPEERERCIIELYNTAGVYTKFMNFKKFLDV